MNIHNFTVDTFDFHHLPTEILKKVEKLSSIAYDLKEPASENYDIIDWRNKKHTLMHTLCIAKRYDLFSVVSDSKGNPIAMSGSYIYEGVPIIGVRTFTHPDYRGGGYWCQARYIFPEHIEYYKELGYDKVWFTFNEYNHRLVNFLRRISEGKASTFGGPRQIYQNLTWYDEPKVIQYTKQTVAELKL